MVAQEEVTTHKKTRITSVVAATAIALACGTNVGNYTIPNITHADKL